MNWSRTKLIFIATFLFLDVFLGFQLYERRKSADEIPPLSEKKTPEEILEDNNITYESELPQISAVTYIKGKRENFTVGGENLAVGDETGVTGTKTLIPEVAALETGEDGKPIQKIEVGFDGTTLFSTFTEPIDIPDDPSVSDIEQFLETYVYKGTKYRFWKRERDSLIFVQTFRDHPVFQKSKSHTGSLQVRLKDGKITGYRQTYLNFKSYEEEKDLIPAIKALTRLLQEGALPVGGTVRKVEFCYDNLILQNLGPVKVFVPAWHVIIQKGDSKETKEYFVNALTGVVQTLGKSEETE